MTTGIELKILSFFHRPSLKPAWTFTVPGVLWRLFPAKSGEIVGESRDQGKKQASFFALDSRTGKPLWENLVLDEPWWIGIEDVAEGVLLLHKFSSPDMPGHRGMIGVDLQKGVRLWSNDELTFWFVHQQSIFAHRMMFEKRVVCELDIRSGQILREIGEDSETEVMKKREATLGLLQEEIHFPEKGEMELLDPAISKKISRELSGWGGIFGFEYVMSNGFLAMNFHVPSTASSVEKPLLDNHFSIFDLNRGKVLFTDCINHNSPALVPDSFFVRKGVAYYVKDQRTLTAINLFQ